MPVPETRLFHLHYHVPDVEYAERALSERGLPLHATFGSVDDEMVALRPEDEVPAEFQFRLQDAQRGYANVTLTEGPRVQFDHVGICTSRFESVVEHAAAAGWNVHGVDEPRTFLLTPWQFRIEVHPEGNRVEQSLGSWEEGHFSSVDLTVPDAEAVRRGIESVVGEIPGLTVREAQGERPHIPEATLAGDAFPDGRTIRADQLERASDEQ